MLFIDPNAQAENQLKLERLRAENEAKRIEQLRAQGLNPDGSPIRPEFQSLIDPQTGKLQSQYQLNAQNYDPNTSEGYKAVKAGATRTGPSDWAKLMQQRSMLAQQDQQAAAGRQAMSGLNQANAALASKGGLSQSARIALAKQGNQGLLQARQQAVRSGITDRLGIDTQDEKDKQDLIKNLLQTDVQVGQYNTTANNQATQGNISNLLNEMNAQRANTLDVWKQQMETWAANKQADATANSGGGGKK